MSAAPRVGFAATAAAVLSLLLSTSVKAALVLILSQSSGSPGTGVQGHTGGNHAFVQQVAPLPTYLVDQAVADRVTSPEDARLVRVGRLVVDAHGNGPISFVVPDLPPGRYAVIVYCPICARYSVPPGRLMVPVAAFTIVSGPPNTATLRSSLPLPAALGLILLAVGALWVLTARLRALSNACSIE